METSAVTDESALEWFFDHFVENKVEKEEEEEEEPKVEPFVSSPPDESRQEDPDTDNKQSENYSSQNSTAAVELPGGSSSLKLDTSTDLKPETVPQIENVISTARLGCHLDLRFIASKVWNVEYRPKAYNALVMRIREPRTTAVIYESGNLVCTGAKSAEQSRVAARRYARIIQKLGFPVRFLNFQIHNLVASCKTFPLSLDRMALEERCSYEPELFPGLHCRVIPGITATIFSSGKMSLSGAKEVTKIYEAFETIYPKLSRFRRQ